MTTLRERQDNFIETMELLGDWTERFNYLISESEKLPQTCPENLLRHRIETCRSKTCFRAELLPSPCGEGLGVRCEGWSNSSVLGGLIVCICEIFNNTPYLELTNTNIDFHTRSGLIDNLTALRREGVEEIIRRINKLF